MNEYSNVFAYGSRFVNFTMKFPVYFKKSLQRDRVIFYDDRIAELQGAAIIAACEKERADAIAAFAAFVAASGSGGTGGSGRGGAAGDGGSSTGASASAAAAAAAAATATATAPLETVDPNPRHGISVAEASKLRKEQKMIQTEANKAKRARNAAIAAAAVIADNNDPVAFPDLTEISTIEVTLPLTHYMPSRPQLPLTGCSKNDHPPLVSFHNYRSLTNTIVYH